MDGAPTALGGIGETIGERSDTRSWVGSPHSFPSTAESVRGRRSDLTPISVVAQEARTVGQPPPDRAP